MPNPYSSTGSVSTVTASVSSSSITGAPMGGMDNFDSPKGSLNTHGQYKAMSAGQVTRRLLGWVRPYRWAFASTFAASVVSIALQLYTPLLVGDGIDLLIGQGNVDFDALVPLLAKLGVVVIAAAVFQLVQGLCLNKLTYKTVCDLRTHANSKLTRIPLSVVDQHAHGDLIARVTTDIDLMGDGLLQGMTQLFSGVVTIAGTIAFMVATSVPMAFVVILITPLSMLAVSIIARFSSSSFAKQAGIQGAMTGYVEEYVGAQKLVDAFAYGRKSQAGFESLNKELYTAGERAQFLSSLSNPGTRFVNNIMYGVVAVVGCISVITGAPAVLTVGQVQVFLSYTGQYAKPFNEISGVVSQIQAAYASARRVFTLLDAMEETDDSVADGVNAENEPVDAANVANITAGTTPKTIAKPMRGEVEFKHVNFSYTPERPLLQDICLHARPGMRMALVGPTGCGKTTLINLLLRFYDIDVGELLIDGRSIQDYTRQNLRSAFGMVLQESWIFEGTVHDNIAYGRPGATRAQVEEAARKTHVDAFIRTLPQGYDTVLPENGGSLSQGQRQLICIARVMLADPCILLLDEATSSIDTRTELQIQAAFDELMQGRTSFVVAHRLSTIREADRIVVMNAGRIVEQGTHDELLHHGGAYAELYQSQFATAD